MIVVRTKSGVVLTGDHNKALPNQVPALGMDSFKTPKFCPQHAPQGMDAVHVVTNNVRCTVSISTRRV